VKYYSKLPEERPVDVALILDPMLATGGSVIAAAHHAAAMGRAREALSLIASEEGVKLVESGFPIRKSMSAKLIRI
jgi:uracil phosphoribosyltransferase